MKERLNRYLQPYSEEGVACIGYAILITAVIGICAFYFSG